MHRRLHSIPHSVRHSTHQGSMSPFQVQQGSTACSPGSRKACCWDNTLRHRFWDNRQALDIEQILISVTLKVIH